MKKRILFAGIFACITALFLMTGCPHHSSSGGWYLPGNTNPGGEGQITNADVKIVKSEGLLNSAYVIFEQIPNAEYTVLIDGKELDEQLIRYYDTYTYYEASESNGQTTWTKKTRSNVVRADALGLKAESHTMQVAVKGSTRYSTATMIVADHDRSGFAFTGSTTPGAYNKDGTLKDNAVVLYLTDENKDTVSLTVTTSAKGATTKYDGIQNILDGYKKGYETKPLAIRMIGNVNTPSIAYDGDLVIENDKKTTGITFEGVGHDATANGWGIRVKGASYIEISNIGFVNCSSKETDNIGLQQDNTHIWVHNCDMFYGDAGKDSDQAKGDGALDCKKSNYVTFSYNHFWDNGKCNLLGLSENKISTDSDAYYITYHHNWYDHSDSRHPRVRFYNAHVYNNYYDGNAKYGAGATMGSSVFVESNYFRSTANMRPMMIAMQGTDYVTADNPSKGTFSSEDGGIIKAYGNKFNCTAENRFLAYGATPTLKLHQGLNSTVDFDAYVVTDRNGKVPDTVVTKQGGNHYSNFDTAGDFYSYTADTPEVAKKNIMDYAGRHNPDFAWTFDNATEDKNSDVITGLKSAIVGYRSGLKKAQGTGGGSGTTTPGGDSGDTGGGDSGNTGGNTGSGNVEITGDVECNFMENKPSNSAFTVSGNYSNSKGSASVNGTTYTVCVKMESSTSIKFSTTEAMTLTLVFSNQDSQNIKVDGTKYTADANSTVITVSLAAGAHEITKADTANLFYISLKK